MISIIAPEEYKVIPWKNGLGETTELAINEGGSVDDFDWRISIASVVNDGPFSDFTGYDRNLVLIEGKGIDLHYGDGNIESDELNKLLDVARFNGSCKTTGILKQGPIKDFNLITRSDKFRTELKTYIQRQTIQLESCELCFLFCLNTENTLLSSKNSDKKILPPHHLMRIENPVDGDLTIHGEEIIVVQLFAH